MSEDLVRIGEKVISLHKIHKTVEEILKLRGEGQSQQEVAHILGLDRAFISRLEGMGEVRRGKKIAVVGFPLQNRQELKILAEEMGVEFTLFMNQEERWKLVREKSGLDFFNTATGLITQLQAYERVLLVTSRKWLELADALLDGEVFFMELGESPITEDVYLPPQKLGKVLEQIIS